MQETEPRHSQPNREKRLTHKKNLYIAPSEPLLSKSTNPLSTKGDRAVFISQFSHLPANLITLSNRNLKDRESTLEMFASILLEEKLNGAEIIKKERPYQISHSITETDVQNIIEKSKKKSNELFRRNPKGTMFVNELWGKKHRTQVLKLSEIEKDIEEKQKMKRDNFASKLERLKTYYKNKLPPIQADPQKIMEDFEQKGLNSPSLRPDKRNSLKSRPEERASSPQKSKFSLFASATMRPSIQIHSSQDNQNKMESPRKRLGISGVYLPKALNKKFREIEEQENKKNLLSLVPIATGSNDEVSTSFRTTPGLQRKFSEDHQNAKMNKTLASTLNSRSVTNSSVKLSLKNVSNPYDTQYISHLRSSTVDSEELSNRIEKEKSAEDAEKLIRLRAKQEKLKKITNSDIKTKLDNIFEEIKAVKSNKENIILVNESPTKRNYKGLSKNPRAKPTDTYDSALFEVLQANVMGKRRIKK